jgi:hypothetical protein
MSESRLEELKTGIEQVRNGGLAVVFKNLYSDVPAWDSFVAFTHYRAHKAPGNIPMQPLEERVINGVVLRNLFYLMVGSPEEEYFPQITEITNTFSELLGGEVLPVSAFINFIGKEKPIAPHCDMRETVYWQCQGTALWRIYAESPINEHNVGSVKPVAEHLLHPGDVIYVGREVGHSVVTDEPRCAIGFQYNQDNSRFKVNHDIVTNHYKSIGVEIVEPRY